MQLCGAFEFKVTVEQIAYWNERVNMNLWFDLVLDSVLESDSGTLWYK